ncbi:hypothetical protein HYS47_00640 [Candidatus Woesearchaeota archaeon]|nr:hypothetical protein [Candidatus Woesearchaeota archaeon]
MIRFDLESIASRFDAVFIDANVFAIGQLPQQVRELRHTQELSPYLDQLGRARERLSDMRGGVSSGVSNSPVYNSPVYITCLVKQELEIALGMVSGSIAHFGRLVKREGMHERLRYAPQIIRLTRLAAEFSHLVQEFPVYPLDGVPIPRVPGTPSEADASLIAALFHYATAHHGKTAAAVSYDKDVVKAYRSIARQSSISENVLNRTRVVWYAPREKTVLELTVEEAAKIGR